MDKHSCACVAALFQEASLWRTGPFSQGRKKMWVFFHFWKMKEWIWFLSLHWSGWTSTYLPSLDVVHQTSSPVRLAADCLMQTWPPHNNPRHPLWPFQSPVVTAARCVTAFFERARVSLCGINKSPVVMAARCMTAFFERARVSLCVINKKKMACLFLILILSSATLVHSPFPYFAICLLQFASF